MIPEILVVLILAQASGLPSADIGNIEVIRNFLAAGGDANIRDGFGQTLLHFSANRPDIVALLLEHNANANARSKNGTTPLDMAAFDGNIPAAELLIASGADVRAAYPSGRTALHVAADAGRAEIVRLLIQNGADPNQRAKNGAAPIDEAIEMRHPETVLALLQSGARINDASPQTGMTPLSDAAKRGNAAIVQLLLERNADVRIKDKAGLTALGVAIRFHRSQVASILLAQEDAADLASDSNALPEATLQGLAEIVQSLLAKGANVNAQDLESGDTPLYIAASLGRTEIVTLLLEKGADPNIPNGAGATALHAALANGFQNIAEKVREHGGR